MAIPTNNAELVAAPRPKPADDTALMFERLAKDASVDVEKLERLIAMQERIIAVNARAEFNAAFADMQGDIPVITERGAIEVSGVVRSTYARNEDIQRIVKPILQQHGFSLRFRNEFNDGKLKVVGILAHRSGHSEQDEFVTLADKSGSKNDIQALGSSRSYGQRYTTISLLNIATCGEDDDAQRSRRTDAPEVVAPAGFDDWWLDMQSVAEDGWDALKAAWNASDPLRRTHVTKTNPNGWEALRRKAAARKAQ